MAGQYGTFLEHLGAMDWGILTLVALSAFWGLVRGISQESGALLVWVGSAWLAIRGGGPVLGHLAPLLAPSLMGSPFLYWGGRLVLFVLVLIVLNLLAGQVARQMARGARQVLSGPLDALLGAGFGILRGYVVLVLLFCAGGYLAQDWLEAAMRDSKFTPWIVRGVVFLQGYVPASWSAHLVFPFADHH